MRLFFCRQNLQSLFQLGGCISAKPPDLIPAIAKAYDLS